MFVRVELFAQAMQVFAIGRRPQSVIPYLVKTVRQDVLEKSTDELVGRQRHCTLPGIVYPSIAERHPVVVHREDATVGDGDPVHVASQVGKHGVGMPYGWLGARSGIYGHFFPVILATFAGDQSPTARGCAARDLSL